MITQRIAILSASDSHMTHKVVKRRPSVEQRIAFCEARKQGRTIVDSCGIAGISRQSGSRWERQRRMVEEGNKPLDPLGPHLSRGEALALVSEDYRTGDWRTRQQTLGTISAMMGWNAPSKSEVTHRVVPQQTTDWIDADEHPRLVANEQHALPHPHSPNADVIDIIESPKQNSTKSGGDE